MTKGRGMGWLGLALALSSACSSEDPQTSADLFCDGVCKAVLRCGLNSDAGSCHGGCVSSANLSDVSREGAKHLGDCMARVECSTLEDEDAWKTDFDACWQSAKPLVPVTQDVRDLCERFVKQQFECGVIFSTHDCESNLGMWAPPVLDKVSGCVSRTDCTSASDCLEAAFGE